MISETEMTWTSGLIPMIEPEVVSQIISRIADLALVISASGTVLGVLSNPNSTLTQSFSRWEGQPLGSQLTVESVPKFEERLASFVKRDDGVVRPVELNHTATDDHLEFPMRYSFHRIGTDGAVLMLGQDLRPVAEMQQQLVAAQIALEKDYENQREADTRFRVLMGASREGVLFISTRTGQITDCNAPAVSLLGAGRGALVGRALNACLSMDDGGDLMESLSDLARAQSTHELSARTAGGARDKPASDAFPGDRRANAFVPLG